ncbi:hypothetical protein AAG570_012113 [Ranatra chinensis]|uniref:Uncharacterized protein n=1 Tax=Ranatra chinensis TaxID=642074 RepID=A0ABD0YU79_9HEMI
MANSPNRMNRIRLVWWHPAVPNLVHFYRSRRECGNLSSAELSCLMNAVALHPEVIVHCELPDQLSGVLEAIGVRPKGLTVKRWPSLVQPLDTPFHRHSLYNALQILK